MANQWRSRMKARARSRLSHKHKKNKNLRSFCAFFNLLTNFKPPF